MHPALLIAVHRIQDDWGRRVVINSGYRCYAHNLKIGGAINSAHTVGMACDIADHDGALKEWLCEDSLAIYGLWMEDPRETPEWCHIQIRPASKRIFLR